MRLYLRKSILLTNINMYLFLKGSDTYLHIYLFNKELLSAHFLPGIVFGAKVAQ